MIISVRSPNEHWPMRGEAANDWLVAKSQMMTLLSLSTYAATTDRPNLFKKCTPLLGLIIDSILR